MNKLMKEIKGTPVGLTKRQVFVNFALLAAVMVAVVVIEAVVR